MFTRQALWRLILPLVLEQLLLVTVGMADTVMVSTVGEAAVSGISLVDQVNVLLIQIFAALATGGAVVASQYLGRRDRENACRSAKQLVYATFGMAVAIGALVLVLNRHILRLVFGNVEPDVMQAAETYFWLSALSYPMLALYNAGAALFRSMGNSRISLFASLIMNVINIGGNALLIYGLNWGVAGAATATLASRTVAGLMMMLLLRNRDNPIFLERLFHPEWNGGILKSILRVGVPNGLENGMFQIGKLLVAGLITTFGTSAIAANAICNNVGSMSNIPGSAIGLAMITVVGQCVGAKDYQQARHYTKTLLAAAYVSMGLLNIALFLLATFLTKNFFGSYNLKNLTKQGAIVGVLAVAQTFIIITSGIDISGGAIAGLGCMTMAMIMNGKGASMLGIAILANFVVCTLCGFLNGVIIFDLKVPAMIATLGTQTIFRGILKLLCNGNSISFFEPDGATFVKLFDTIGNYDIFGVLPVLACIWIVVAVIAFLVLRYTVFGRDLFVIGSGIEVARLSGIKVRKTFYLVYSLAGFVYGIAAIMFAGRILRAMPNTGDGYDMDAIAAAVIGGASLAGGRGAITGTFVGTLLMVVIKNAGKAFQINDYILDVITGALIIFAVAMDMVKSRKKA